MVLLHVLVSENCQYLLFSLYFVLTDTLDIMIVLYITIAFHLNRLRRYHEPVLAFIKGDHVSFHNILVL